jgi:hypothetical protein
MTFSIRHKWIVLMIFIFISQGALGQMANYKSLYIYNFVKRIEWSNKTNDSVFNLVVIGDKETADALSQIALTKKAGDKPIVVSILKELTINTPVDLIYVDYSKRKYLEELSLIIENKPILLVTDYKNALNSDINLIETDDGLDFVIRPQKIREKGLKLSDSLILLGKLEEDE